jgi:hypothetical protein
MRTTVKTGILFAIAWILVKLAAFGMGYSTESLVPLVFLNMFFLLAAISIGLFLTKRGNTKKSSTLNDIKNGLTAGVPYAILIGSFLFLYYNNIDPEYNAHQIREKQMELKIQLDDPVSFVKLKASNEEFEVMTKEQIVEKSSESLKAFYNPKFTMTLTLLALLLLSTIYSIFVTIVMRRIIFRNA